MPTQFLSLPAASSDGRRVRRAVHLVLGGPSYAFLLGPTLVLASYGTTHASPYQLVRPLAAAILVGMVLMGAFGFASRRWHASALVASGLLLTIVGMTELVGAVVIALLFVLLRKAIWHVPGPTSKVLTRPLNAVVAAWFVLASATAVVVSLPPNLAHSDPISLGPGPNVYLLLLDAYPRHDSLMEYFNFDNGRFLAALEERGFDVAEESTSPYVATIQVVPTMFQMRPMDDLLNHEPWDELDITNGQHRRLWHMLNSAPVVDAFESAGYTTISITSSAEDLDWQSADVVLSSAWPTRFEDHLIGRGLLGPFLPFGAMDRAELLDGFRHLEESVATSPRFVFAHMMTPHNPYVFTAEGDPAAPCGQECANHAGPPNEMLAERFIGQLRWTNERVLAVIDRIVAVDPDATVIVFSDHGLRRDLNDMDEWHRTLFAARGASFAEDANPMDIFPAVVDARVASGMAAP